GRLGGGALRGARQKAPLPGPPLRLRRKGGRQARFAPPLWPRSGQGGGWEGVLSGRSAESTPPRPSPAPAAQGRETSPLCPSPLAAQRTRGRLGGGALRGARQKAPLPGPPLRLRRK